MTMHFYALVHCYIRESICFCIVLAIDVCKSSFSSPAREGFMDLQPDFFELWVFDLVVSRELLDHELGVCAEFYLCCTEFYSTLYTKESTSILCDIIGGNTEIFVPTLCDSSIERTYKNPASSRTRVSTRTSICVDYVFHIIYRVTRAGENAA